MRGRPSSFKRLRQAALGFVFASCTLLLAACGASDDGDGDGDGDPGRSNTAAGEPVAIEYSGPEQDLPTEYPEPESCDATIGWQVPLAANESLSAQQRAVELEVARLGGEVVVVDDQLSVDRQVSNFRQLIARDVDAIGFFPIDPGATEPVLDEAEREGIPVVAIEKTQDVDADPGKIATQIWQGRDTQAFRQVREMARLAPGGDVTLINIGAPVPALKYLLERQEYWAERVGLNVLGAEESPSDEESGGQVAMNALLAEFPEFDGTIAYNDATALAAAAAARSAGRQEVPIIGLNGDSTGLQGIESGRIAATFQLDSVGIGTQAGRALCTLASDPEADLPPILLRPPSEAITQENVDQATTWEQQLEEIQQRNGVEG